MGDVRVQPSISDEAVSAKTGKTWPQWFRNLDQAGAQSWNHKQIVAHLRDGYMLDGWWQQMVAVTYEQARGLRDKHEQPDGYQIQRQKTIHAPVERAWRAWADETQRLQWLPDAAKIRIRGERPEKMQGRFDWMDGRTRVLFAMHAQGEGKCAVGVQHSKISTADEAERLKEFWTERLVELKKLCEAGQA